MIIGLFLCPFPYSVGLANEAFAKKNVEEHVIKVMAKMRAGKMELDDFIIG